MPFQKIKVRPKKEIVTLRTKFSNPETVSGKKLTTLTGTTILMMKKQ